MDDETEVIDSSTDTEDTETEGTETEETQVDVAKLQETNKKLFERAKKAEAELKAQKEKAPQTQTQQAPADIDERILKSQGMNDEMLTQLKKIAQIEGVSLIDAQSSDLFVAVKDKFEREQRAKAAQMPTSRGSGVQKPRVTLTTPGLTREQHKALLKG